MDPIIRTTTRFMFPFILLFGAYIAVHGHLSPGGGFPAGATIASAFTLLVLTYREKEVEGRFTEVELIDAKSIASVALLALLMLDIFIRADLVHHQQMFTIWSGGETIFSNIFGSLIVSTGIIIVVYSLIKEEWKR